MCMPRILGVFALVPAAVLLAISFFILFAISKVEKQGLKAFGYVVAAVLWAVALLCFSAGIYKLSLGGRPMMGMMCQGPGAMSMMQGQGKDMMQQAQGQNQGMARGGNKGMMKCGSADTSMGR